ncbi:MAG: poly-gamma-glutamate biosynthesis protein PgsC [Algicola sp.]|nr:poly-gamma-glutamate biosynthesis protein PgsC [Algicola sp.]
MVSSLTLSIGFGLLVGLSFIELFSLFCGGVIVPGYIALHLDNPWSVAATLAISLMTYGVVKAVSSVVLIYGRRQYVAMLIAAFVLGTGFNMLLPMLADNGQLPFTLPGSSNDQFGIIGFVIPGLIANWFDRQGIIVTTCTVITSAILVRLALLALPF